MSVEVLPDIPPPAPAPKPRLKRLRLVAIIFSLLLLGLVSFAFGMFVSIASDLPSLTRFSQYKDAQSSELLDDLGRPIGVLSQQNRVIVTPGQIPPIVKQAVISIEDKRFETNSGIDLRGIARAFIEDIRHKGSVQGASTIEQQFIKNALQAQSHRTIFEKLREAALAYQLSHKWSKEKIITAYLNTIYFGNGAYGIEAAAQTYFGHDVNHLGCGMPSHQLCVEQLQPWEAALLAGIIQSPTAYDPAEHPLAAQEQTIEGVDAGYFTSWVQQEVIERYGAPRAFDGGLRVKTTLDLELQKAAEQAIGAYLPGPEGPSAAMVVIENSTGAVRAMVGGRNYDESPFNLATEGERQPGSSFKAFDLAAALRDGISPDSVWTSEQKTFIVPNSRGQEKFVVHNDEGAYSGSNTLLGATAFSDNSIYAEVGLKVGTHQIARLAHRMGITTPLSTNPAMTIGGLTVGVTPLDMAHAYETIAHKGERVSGTLAEPGGPVGIQEVEAGGQSLPDGARRDVNHPVLQPILTRENAETETSMLEAVIQYGTGRAAAIGQFAAGKTGTTSNYGDAWFVGWNSTYTVAVWVGYPTRLIPMTTDFNGGPVLGGTFPALIWHQFMVSALQIDMARAEHAAAAHTTTTGGAGGTSTTGGGEGGAAPSTSTTPGPSTSQGGGGQQNATPVSPGSSSGQPSGAPATPSPERAPATPTPATPTPSPSSPAPAPSPPAAAPSAPSGTGSGTGGVGAAN